MRLSMWLDSLAEWVELHCADVEDVRVQTQPGRQHTQRFTGLSELRTAAKEAKELEKGLADCKRAWELHDSDISELKETLPYNRYYYLRLAREEADNERAD